MKVTLLNEPDKNLSGTVQVLLNRGIDAKNMTHYLNTTDEDINEPAAFGQDLLTRGARMLISHIAAEHDILVVVDADCDGFTSSAVLINYLYDVFPAFVENHLHWFIHGGKQHGLSDCINEAKRYKLVILPDSSSNDYEYHKILSDNGIDVLVLDHHEAEKVSDYACVINNQLSDYPNKEFSGAGVTWQFCRYLDQVGGNAYAKDYYDLVALGNMADMMSMKSIETKHLIHKGFQTKNIKNPFIFEMAEKNSFSLGKADYKPSADNKLQITPMGAAFFIAPFVNAMVRSGTQEEKELLFNSMLKFKAFEMILSNKRGHKPGEMERVVDQAIRTCTNVKNRQTRAQDAGMEFLENMIERDNLLEHKVLLFLLEPGEIDRNIAGLVANKLMAKYQRPVCVLTKVTEKIEIDFKNGEYINCEPYTKISYQGSARGYDASGITNFKDICAAAPGVMFAEGHQGAFGLGLNLGVEYGDERDENFGDEIYQFLSYTDKVLKNMSSEPSFFVDYIWDADKIDGDKILEMAAMNDYLGKDIDRPFVMIKNIKVSQDTLNVYKGNTLKINTPSNIPLMKFGGTEEELDLFNTPAIVTINAVCRCNANEYNWEINPQLMIEAYEIVETPNATAADLWGF